MSVQVRSLFCSLVGRNAMRLPAFQGGSTAVNSLRRSRDIYHVLLRHYQMEVQRSSSSDRPSHMGTTVLFELSPHKPGQTLPEIY